MLWEAEIAYPGHLLITENGRAHEPSEIKEILRLRRCLDVYRGLQQLRHTSGGFAPSAVIVHSAQVEHIVVCLELAREVILTPRREFHPNLIEGGTTRHPRSIVFLALESVVVDPGDIGRLVNIKTSINGVAMLIDGGADRVIEP